ncbi:unnamed protein product [Mycena citricolor]|uniref:Uncharacterized protein n=1 Tax=Mycena citricolor TaxID=2018698 RepID=A0AAD2H9H4_9AGAR|nr:unnamed protein product [Mycena citricolor]
MELKLQWSWSTTANRGRTTNLVVQRSLMRFARIFMFPSSPECVLDRRVHSLGRTRHIEVRHSGKHHERAGALKQRGEACAT